MSRTDPIPTGRFAPSPTGALHMGSLVAAVASYLDARAMRGRWLIRIEDVDTVRAVPGSGQAMIAVLADLGMVSDAPVQWQSNRAELYTQALERLRDLGLVYGCRCSRAKLGSLGNDSHYPGTCRALGLLGSSTEPLAVRVMVGTTCIAWVDRAGARHVEDLSAQGGDFIVRRKDGLWSYQLAVVVDDAEQGVTHVVRGEDLVESTARQCFLYDRLGLARPSYLHIPLVRDAQGNKLSKSRGAQSLRGLLEGRDTERQRVRLLDQALEHLGLPGTHASSIDAFWPQAISAWAYRHPTAPEQPA